MKRSFPVGVDGLSDESLLRGFAAGDANTGLAFVRRFQGRVYGMCLHVLGDRGLAEDAAQEAFLRAWNRADTYESERGTVTAWLLRITHNLAIDHLRRRRPQPADTESIAKLIPTTTANPVEDAAVTSDLAAQARAAIGCLPLNQARALLLATFYGYTANQIAVSESIPLGTAKTRIRQGLRALRANLMVASPTSFACQ